MASFPMRRNDRRRLDGDLLRMDSEQGRARHHRVGALALDLKNVR